MDRNKLENIILSVITLLLVVIITIIVIMFSGCSVKPEIIYRDRIINVSPPIIHDTVTAVELDTVVIGHNIIKNDTVAVIKYFPKWKYFDYTIKPDTIKLLVRDTIMQKIEKVVETPLTSKIGLICTGLVIGLTTMLFIKWKY